MLLLVVPLSALKPAPTAKADTNAAGNPLDRSPSVLVPDPSSQTAEVRTSAIVCASEVSASDRASVPLSDNVPASPSVNAPVSPAAMTGWSFVPLIVTTMSCMVIAVPSDTATV